MTVSVLPMETQIGDRFTDHDFEWEVLTHPAVLHVAKSQRARLQSPGVPLHQVNDVGHGRGLK